MDVLVLNAAYQPVAMVPWRDAFTKMYSLDADDRVEIVSTYPDRIVRSAHIEHPMPAVVRHVKFAHVKHKGIRFSRPNVWARDRGRCQYCGIQVPLEGANRMEYEHVIPRSQGGKTDWDNIVTACNRCNQRKAGRTPAQAGMKLLSKPARPNALPEDFKRKLRWRKGMPDEWKAWFPPEQYWHGGLEESEE